MSQGNDGERVLPDSVNAMLEDLGNTEYLHAVLGLADPSIAPASRADQRDPQRGRGGNRPRAVSCVSHVNLDYFDPRGVGALRHTLSRMSTAPTERTQIGRPGGPLTAEAVGEAFDFEVVLRDVLKRCDLQCLMFPFCTDQRLCS